MKFAKSTAVLAALPAIVSAHLDSHHRARHAEIHARQDTVAAGSIATSSPVALAAGAASGASSSVVASAATTAVVSAATTAVASGATTAAPVATTPSVTFTLLSTNPTAIPLSVINSLQPSSATRPLDVTAVPGTKPTFLPNAPALPDASLLKPANYPALDKTPPIDSAEVQQWIKDVKNTGIVIPSFSATNPGGCPNNTAAVADSSRCWWTCGGCTRATDVSECPTAMDWGLTYDDGPSFYTSTLLNYLDEQKLKSTFFVVGSRVISFPNILQSEYIGQHQISVHTWSHSALTTLSNEQIIAELGWSKKVIKDVLGVTPNTMRPPYGDIDDRVRAISIAMGLTPIMWTRISATATFDTDDFNIHSGATSVQQVLHNWGTIIANATTRSDGFIVLEHDLFEQAVEVATGYILPDALAHTPKFTIKPVITCLNKPMQDAYIETNNNSTNPPALSAAVSAGLVKVTATANSGAVSLSMNNGGVVSFATVILGLAVGGLASMRF